MKLGRLEDLMLKVPFLKKAYFFSSLLKQNRFLVMAQHRYFLMLAFNCLKSTVSLLAF